MRVDKARALEWSLLIVAALTLVGMALGSWQLVLYPSLLMVGALLALALLPHEKSAFGVPLCVTGLLVALFVVLHAMGVAEPSGEGSVLGWDPMTALYLFVVGPAFVLVGLLYAVHDRSTAQDREAVR